LRLFGPGKHVEFRNASKLHTLIRSTLETLGHTPKLLFGPVVSGM